MSSGGQTVRAFRPSMFGQADALDEETEHAREVNVQRYAERAKAGLPLFEDAAELEWRSPTTVHRD